MHDPLQGAQERTFADFHLCSLVSVLVMTIQSLKIFFLDVCYMDKVRTVNTRSIPKLFFWAHFNFRYALDLAKSKVKIQISNSHLNTFEFHLLQIVFHTIQNFNAKVQTCVNRAYFPALHQFNGSSFIQFIIWV